jgi:DNA-binding transcriptional regulator YiaG
VVAESEQASPIIAATFKVRKLIVSIQAWESKIKNPDSPAMKVLRNEPSDIGR